MLNFVFSVTMNEKNCESVTFASKEDEHTHHVTKHGIAKKVLFFKINESSRNVCMQLTKFGQIPAGTPENSERRYWGRESRGRRKRLEY